MECMFLFCIPDYDQHASHNDLLYNKHTCECYKTVVRVKALVYSSFELCRAQLLLQCGSVFASHESLHTSQQAPCSRVIAPVPRATSNVAAVIVTCYHIPRPAVILQAAWFQAVNHKNARLLLRLLVTPTSAAVAVAVAGAVSAAAGLGTGSVGGGGLGWEERGTACVRLKSHVHDALRKNGKVWQPQLLRSTTPHYTLFASLYALHFIA